MPRAVKTRASMHQTTMGRIACAMGPDPDSYVTGGAAQTDHLPDSEPRRQ